jgi:hypothetical protein
MNDTVFDTQQCPNCGHVNESGRAVCANCQLPLTAYSGQVSGDFESSRGKLAQQVSRLNVRPPIVAVVALCDLLFALFWPLAYVVNDFANRPRLNGEMTNYLGSAFGAIGPFLHAIVLVPIGLALIGLAWATWTERAWAWSVNAIGLAAFVLLSLRNFGVAPIMTIIWVVLAGGVAFVWFRSETKAWFGMD